MKFELYDIRCAKATEYERIRDFINNDWKKNHILAVSKKLFDFQHLRPKESEYDFVIAEHKTTKQIHAVYGYINSAIYDQGSCDNPNAVWGALWKVKKGIENKEVRKLGLGVLLYIIDRFPKTPFITLGLSKDSQTVFEGLNFVFGKMNHYYIASDSFSKYNIIESPKFKDVSTNSEYSFSTFDFKQNIESDYLPLKNNSYLARRYSNHPFYKYLLLGLYKGDVLINVWVIREIDINNAKCLRLVDIVGRTKGLPDVSYAIKKLLNHHGAEYIDCYNYGVSEQEFNTMGFLTVESPTIVPNYFEPYEKRNVDIYFAYTFDKDICIFKGDGDQDRPSLI